MRTDSGDRLSSSASTAGVVGNARITGTFGAVIFVLLFVEGITILRVQALISLHAFVGMLLVPFVIVKIASTAYRFVRYYRGQAEYTAKGPPPLLLRALGPVVMLTTVAVLATGVGTLLTDRRPAWLLQAHKISFILWFAAMTVHVLGHALETPALAIADLRFAARAQAPGATTRNVLLLVTAIVGIALGVLSIGWAHHWQALRGR
jgi:hypothetical protein